MFDINCTYIFQKMPYVLSCSIFLCLFIYFVESCSGPDVELLCGHTSLIHFSEILNCYYCDNVTLLGLW